MLRDSEYSGGSAQLEESIARAQGNLLRLQSPEGYWCGELMADATLCADYVLFMFWSGERDAVLEGKCAAHIRRRQQSDGGWSLYEGGPSDVSASVKAYFALKLAGDRPECPRMLEARACILRLGGIPRMNTYAKLYLALLGQFPWRFLPTVPVEFVLFPRWFFFNLYELSSWSRAMLVPIAILNHFKPTRRLPADLQLHELFPAGSETGFLGEPSQGPWLSWPNFFLFCDRMLKGLGRMGWRPLRKLALRRAEAWMTERMGAGSDGLAAIFPAILNSRMALKVLGYPSEHPIAAKAKRDFENLFVDDPEDFRIQPCLSPVWDTAISLIALAESGLPTGHPALLQGAGWLAAREVRFRGDWRFKNPHQAPSGWAFEFRNEFYPDTDDTMMVLMALRLAAQRSNARLAPDEEERFLRGLNWLLSFQCKNGGWAAFDRDVTQHWLEQVPFADHNAILDPPCSDLTGRMLELLGNIGFDREGPVVKGALQQLRDTQEPDGSWYGRWGVNYLYGTWQVLRGLRAIGQDLRQDWIVRARDWLESCQNEDGGWGECCGSYDHPELKGRGSSTPSQTAWAVMGLIAATPGPTAACAAVQRGIRFLIGSQSSDGSWTESGTTGTGFPRVFYIRYDMYRNYWPLLALATFNNFSRDQNTAPKGFRISRPWAQC
jgi:squalene-hopene/tetraprenyl-beta-curcumene cyclase